MLTKTALRTLSAPAPKSAWAQPSFARQAFVPFASQVSSVVGSSSPQSSRGISSLLLRRRATLAPYSVPGPSFHTRRAFTSGPSSRSQYNRYNQYNRFGNNRGSLFFFLIQNAKPHHFVILGLGVSGIYLYNTDVISVKNLNPDLPTRKSF